MSFWIGYELLDRLISYPELRFLSRTAFPIQESGRSRRSAGSLMRTLTRRVEQRRFEYENAGGDPVGPRPRLKAVCPAAAGGSLSVVHEMTLVQDLCAGAHQRGQVLVCVVAAEVELATRRHRRTNPGASAAGVATIRRAELRLVQSGAFKSLCVHASITHHRPASRTPVHPGRNRPPERRHNETGEWKSLQRQPQRTRKVHPSARSSPGLVNRGKHPRTRATRTVGHKRALTHI